MGTLIIVALFIINTYNTLVRRRNAFKNAFAQIDVQLKRRYDLIPNLVETAKKFMAHERETLEGVIRARNQAYEATQKASQNPSDAEAIKGLNQAESLLGASMKQFMALFENYPTIKSDQTMSQLMEELTSTENKIAFARQAFNDSVMTYNNAREQFPSNLIANFFNFKEAQLLEIEKPEERQAVKVQF
ncbi:MAG: LemA family protein [Bdellovibrio sp.]|nr:MAG: LemA family protein [Bdellovibrio sp.]